MAPLRERQLLAVGDKGMLLFDELAADGAHLKHFAKVIRPVPAPRSRSSSILTRGEPDRS